MKIGTTGIIFNEFTQVLLMQRDDTRTWSLPGGALDAGELPTDGVAREVREETGLIVLPARLVALTYLPARREPGLLFSFRCIQRGGEIATSAESPQVGWFPTRPLPRILLSAQRRRVQQAFHHAGGPPALLVEEPDLLYRAGRLLLRRVVYPYKDWRLARRGQPHFQPAPPWQISVLAALRSEAGQVVWRRRLADNQWQLPGGDGRQGEAPWATAARLAREATGLDVGPLALSAVTVIEKGNRMVLTFTAVVQEPLPTAVCTYFTPGQEPPDAAPEHRPHAAAACQFTGAPQFLQGLTPTLSSA